MRHKIIIAAAAMLFSTGYESLVSNNTSIVVQAKSKKPKKQAKKYKIRKVKNPIYDVDSKLPAAKTYIANRSSLPKGTKISWSIKPDPQDLDDNYKASAEIKIKFPDKSKKYVSLNISCLGSNQIKVPQGYTLVAVTKADNDGTADSAFIKATQKGYDDQIDQFIPESLADNKEKVSYPNLTAAQKSALGFYANGLVNQIRQQMGAPIIAYSDYVQAAADAVAKEYKDDNYAYSQGHDEAGLHAVLDGEGGWAEDMDAAIDKPKTMTDMKKMIYNNIIRFVFNTKEWHHAGAIVGDDQGLYNQLGVSYTVSRDGYYVTHYIFIP